MGENRASGEGILDGFVGEEVRCAEDDQLQIVQSTVRLNSFCIDKLKCVHYPFSGCNKCNSNFNLEATYMVKSINGEKTYD
jgi:hypothetical protein